METSIEKSSVDQNVKYEVEVKTSDAFMQAGTDATVYVVLVGEDGTPTDQQKLDNFLRNDHERGRTDHFTIWAKDVGLPCLIKIFLKGILSSDEWLCETIMIRRQDDEVNFVIYDWIDGEKEVARGDAMLTRKIENRYLLAQRHREVEKHKAEYTWADIPLEGSVGWGLPRFMYPATYFELPKFFKYEEARLLHLVREGLSGGIADVLNLLENWVSPIKDIESFKRLYSHNKLRANELPNFLDGWDTDEGMGRQCMTGISPVHFERCVKIPFGFNVTNDDVCAFLSNGTTLHNEIEAGKIYISDYSKVLDGIPRNVHPTTGENLHCPNALALFYVRGDNKFVPIAVQLVPGDRDYLFTPADSKDDWLLAKMYFRSAEGNVHEWLYHFLHTHSIMEPFAVSLFRCFPSSHPIYKLLRPHLQTLPTINVEARRVLLPPTAVANKTLALAGLEAMRKWYESFRMEDLHIPKLLKKKGTLDRNLLPEYYYRDDALALWDIMERYVSGVINYFYIGDEDVKEDAELQDWAQEVAVQGIGWFDEDLKGLTITIASREQLIELCVTLIFTNSVQHAAVNFGQFTNYRLIPNSPLAMREPPHKRGEASQARIMSSLPDIKMASNAVALSFALSSFTPSEVYLGDYRKKLFVEPAVLGMQKNYKQTLEALEEQIEQRNKGLEHPYTFLLPSRIPNYIAV